MTPTVPPKLTGAVGLRRARLSEKSDVAGVMASKFDQPSVDRWRHTALGGHAGISYRIEGRRLRDGALDAVKDVVCSKPMHRNQPWRWTVTTAAGTSACLRATRAAAVGTGIGFDSATQRSALAATGRLLRTRRSPPCGDPFSTA